MEASKIREFFYEEADKLTIDGKVIQGTFLRRTIAEASDESLLRLAEIVRKS